MQGRQAPQSSDPIEILLRHNAWATGEILEYCRTLSEEQLHRRFAIGLGSLHDTLTHIVGAMLRWADRIKGPPTLLRDSIEKPAKGAAAGAGMPRRSIDQLTALLQQADAELSEAAKLSRERGMGSVIELSFGDKTYHFTRAAALVHVTTHGVHHRAQCLNMLRHLDVKGLSDHLPEIDAVEWQAITETHELEARRPKIYVPG